MISIDGSFGEGGGQILRTSIGMSAVTGKPIRIFNIRAKRENPGLQAQHLTSLRAVAALCNASVKGDKIGSSEIEFIPNDITGGKFNFDIGTAGSVTLVLQSLMIPAIFAKENLKIQIIGGTDVRWSPSIDYLKFVTLQILKKFGYSVEINLIKRGYYPKGNGKVEIEINPVEKLKGIELIEHGELIKIFGLSHAHGDLKSKNVVERQASSTRKYLFDELSKIGIDSRIDIEMEYADALSYGSGITLCAEFENTITGVDSLGERNKSSEDVGKEVAYKFIDELKSNAPLDSHMADQIIPYLAIASGKIKIPKMTSHIETNVLVVNKFGFNLNVRGNIIESQTAMLN